VNILGLDTATPATAVAVLRCDGDAFERYSEAPAAGRPRHAIELLGLAEQALAAAGLAWSQIERVGVGVGPGSFTGLRIGIATAQGLAQARALELVGVSTLWTLSSAAQRSTRVASVLALLEAGRGEVFAAAWREHEQLLAPHPSSPATLLVSARRLPPGSLAVGNGSVRLRNGLEAVGVAVEPDDSPLHRVSAAQLCRLAVAASPVAPGALQPAYLREPDARPRASQTP
jgi:tRNA threonylcarbamoyladenosine biosynthesis protein TsaB